MKVLLVNLLNYIPGASSLKKSENLGLGYIGAMLKKAQIAFEILDFDLLELDTSKAIIKVLDTEFDLLGISMPFQDCFDKYIDFVKKLRKLGMDKPIVIGGHPPTFLYEEILSKYSEIDFVSIGEGEETIVELAEALQNNTSLAEIKGLAYRDVDGKIVKNKDRRLIKELDDLPFPYRYIFDMGDNDIRPSILSSRGCFANCSFCDVQTYYGNFTGDKWRPRSPENVVDEIEQIVNEHKKEAFYFADDEFIGPGEKGATRALRIAELILERNIKIRFTFSTRVNTIQYDLFKRLKEAGLVAVFMGVESGVSSMLKYLNKGINQEQIINAIKILNELNLNYTLGSILIGPYSTTNEIKDSIQFWKETTGFSLKCYNNLSIYAGTKVYRELNEKNLLQKDGFNYSYDQIMDPKVLIFRDVMDKHIISYFNNMLMRFQMLLKENQKMLKNKKDLTFTKKVNQLMFTYREKIFYDCFTNTVMALLNYLDQHNNEVRVDEIDKLLAHEYETANSYLEEVKKYIEEEEG